MKYKVVFSVNADTEQEALWKIGGGYGHVEEVKIES